MKRANTGWCVQLDNDVLASFDVSIRFTASAFISYPCSISSHLKHVFSWLMQRMPFPSKVKAQSAHFKIQLIRSKCWTNALICCLGHPEFSLEFLRAMGILRQQRCARPIVTIEHLRMLNFLEATETRLLHLEWYRCPWGNPYGIETENLLIYNISNGFLTVCLQGSWCQARRCSTEQGPAGFFAGWGCSREMSMCVYETRHRAFEQSFLCDTLEFLWNKLLKTEKSYESERQRICYYSVDLIKLQNRWLFPKKLLEDDQMERTPARWEELLW